MHPPPFANAADAADDILGFLSERLGFDLCMLTRTEGEDWIILHARRRHERSGPAAGDVLRWSNSCCSRMVRGEGPSVAPDASAVPAYATAAVSREVRIGSYVGVPIQRPDGSLFGTLCGMHPEPKDDRLNDEEPLLRLFARVLGTVVEAEARDHASIRRAERAEALALSDRLTGLYNRRGWDLLTDTEEQRCRRSGHPACVLSIDLNGLKPLNDARGHAAGDALLVRTAQALLACVREPDVVARVGGDEFLICCVECRPAEGERLRLRLLERFATDGIDAAVGVAARRHGEGLVAATRQADERMYAHKRSGALLPLRPLAVA